MFSVSSCRFLQTGAIVIAPNFRGSTGYGKTFQRLIYKDWGGAEFKDVVESHNYLLSTGYVDKNKIAVVEEALGIHDANMCNKGA
jgi:dipeptidyl aminopeptidase/acylaminoacyl peptidase